MYLLDSTVWIRNGNNVTGVFEHEKYSKLLEFFNECV